MQQCLLHHHNHILCTTDKATWCTPKLWRNSFCIQMWICIFIFKNIWKFSFLVFIAHRRSAFNLKYNLLTARPLARMTHMVACWPGWNRTGYRVIKDTVGSLYFSITFSHKKLNILKKALSIYLCLSLRMWGCGKEWGVSRCRMGPCCLHFFAWAGWAGSCPALLQTLACLWKSAEPRGNSNQHEDVRAPQWWVSAQK